MCFHGLTFPPSPFDSILLPLPKALYSLHLGMVWHWAEFPRALPGFQDSWAGYAFQLHYLVLYSATVWKNPWGRKKASGILWWGSLAFPLLNKSNMHLAVWSLHVPTSATLTSQRERCQVRWSRRAKGNNDALLLFLEGDRNPSLYHEVSPLLNEVHEITW